MKTKHLQDSMIGWRHDFHIHPELGFNEHRTSENVANLLENFGIQVHRGIGGTGVVGVLQAGDGARSIGLRADMDALPIIESGTCEHRSQEDGVMHACGHDGHTAILLGAAKYLADSGYFNGKVVFIFQPNEEHGLGATAMIKDGLFERFDVDDVYGIHNIPGMPVGSFALRSGAITASESLFEIKIKTRGGHAALPHMGVDAIIVGAEIVQSLQTIVSRKLNPALNGVVSVTEFITDGSRNILPGSAILRGDARALSSEINETIEARMRQIVDGICLAHSVSADVQYETVFPAVINTSAPAFAAQQAASEVVGATAVNADCEPKLFSEDFAHMAKAKPGCFVLMGNGTEGANARPLHASDYDFNDDALTIGSSFWVQLVEQQLSKSVL
ncbi:MAG: amidohydrolase [SAR324 cluster bacterium]|nr:amidohydrolase [SAR324 cluster bacterium]